MTHSDSEPLTERSLRRRFLLLTALRWLPVGLLIPIVTLLPLERGLSLTAVGGALATQGLVVFALELPTGGLADAIGRRAVLLASCLFGLAALVALLFADSVGELVLVFALMGVYRALDSGPLEAWYVDMTLAIEPEAEIDRGLGAAGVVLGLAIAGGSLLCGGLVAWNPIVGLDALATPVALALVLQGIGLPCIAVLMEESGRASGWRAAVAAMPDTPAFVADGFRLVRRSRAVATLLGIELFVGFSIAAFETLFPVRLQEILGDADAAATLAGPIGSVAWLASAAGAAVMPWLGRRLGVAAAAAWFRGFQGLAVIGMGLAGGVAGVLVAYVCCLGMHGASNPAHMTLLHREVVGRARATVLSLNSMIFQPASAVGLVVLSAIADGANVSVAMYVGGVALVLATPLYLSTSRPRRRAPDESD